MIKLQSKNKYLAYFAPVIMIIIGIFLYSVILPARYNKIISLMEEGFLSETGKLILPQKNLTFLSCL